MASIFMTDIPNSVNHPSLSKELAKILHSPPFNRLTADERMNFHVYLHRKRGNRARGHKGTGILTLPTATVAQYFLSTYGSPLRPTLPFDYLGGHRRMAFRLSNRDPEPGIVPMILQTPYAGDEAQEQEKEEKEEKLADLVQASSVQLGWRCRDDAVSIEWSSSTDFPHEEAGDHAERLGGINLEFVEDTRELWISLPGSFISSVPDNGLLSGILSLMEPTLHIGLRWNRVQRLDFEREQDNRPAIVFDLYRPPNFERRQASLAMFNSFQDDRPIRTPLTSFPGSHGRVVPYASLVLRVECASTHDFQTFRRMANVASFPSPTYIYTEPVRRHLFSQSSLCQFDAWVAQLDWPIAFQLVAIRDNLYADPIELLELRGRLTIMEQEYGVAKTSEILRLFRARLATLSWDGEDERGATTVPECLSKAAKDVTELHMSLRDQTRNPGYFNCYHVTVTPTRIVPDGPYPDQSNRVLRRYAQYTDCFLRVAFADEDFLSFRWDWGVQGEDFVRLRVGGSLKNGLVIAGRKYQFLLFSQSALKEHAVWFCRPFTESNGQLVTADTIRESLGDFKHLECQPARMAARMSQAFTATEPSVTLEIEEIFPAADIERNGSNFTDGIGDISPDMAAEIARSLQSRIGGKKRFFVAPSAYQFRMGGYKGVLAVDYKLRDMEIKLRKSQSKFTSPGTHEIEIAQAFHKPKPVYLNRNLIMILETLGVPANAFIKLQDEAVDDINMATLSLRDCASFLLDMHGCGTSFRLSSVFFSLSKLGIGLRDEQPTHVLDDKFINRAIEFAANHILRVIKHKARIPVKGSYTLVGVADIHGYLKPDEVFGEHRGMKSDEDKYTHADLLSAKVCIKERDKKTIWIEGKVLVTRSPQAHPGDAQFVYAIGAPPPDSPFTQERNPRPNSIVFSTNGLRSVPSMLAGGDLDGDEFNIICNPALWPPSCDPPAAYPPAVIKTLDRPCNVNDIAEWVAEYINSDILASGMISQDLLIRADQSHGNGLMAREPGCLKLAELASAAVDFAKSGTPVDRKNLPTPLFHRSYKPDWAIGEMGPGRSGQKTYMSKTAIGKLFRRIDLSNADRLADLQARKEHNPHRAIPRKGKARRDMDELSRELERLTVTGIRRADSEDSISFAVRNRLRRYVDVDSPIQPETANVAAEQFDAYVTELRCICSSNTLSNKPLTEEEVLVGTIATKTSQPRKRQNLMAQLRTQSDELVKRIKAELAGERSGSNDDDDRQSRGSAARNGSSELELEEWLLRSWVAWHVSIPKGAGDDARFGAKTFGIIALGSIFECLRELDERDRLAGGI
ncbi:hypothetical protein FRB98_006509 [Tulasnella sp. 332]|nr:hypothetical protein FRB98_006509 [Tulasnella sp. 332]